MNDKELDKLFREQLGQHAVPPRADLWDQIENQLDHRKAAPVRRMGWLRYAAIAVGCLGLTALLYNMLQPVSMPETKITAQKDVRQAPARTVQTITKPTHPKTPVETQQTEEPQQRQLTKTFVQEVSPRAQHKPVSTELRETTERSHVLIALEPADLSLTGTDNMPDGEILQEYVVEVPPIAPLIDNPEAEESMLASAQKTAKELVPGILNKLSDVLKSKEDARIQISKDEEGFLRLDIVNSLVKNRNKKRR